MRETTSILALMALACGAAQPVAAPAAAEHPGGAEVASEPAGGGAPPAEPPEGADPCAPQDAAGCYLAGARHIHGYGVAADPTRGWAMIAAACELGYGTACYDLAQMHAVGSAHVPRDHGAFVRLVIQGCERGSRDACRELETPHRQLLRECAAGATHLCVLLRHLEGGGAAE